MSLPPLPLPSSYSPILPLSPFSPPITPSSFNLDYASIGCGHPITLHPYLIHPHLVLTTRRPLTPRFIAFIAGSFAAILLSASLIDPDLFLHFEITPHRTVLFYLGIFGTILAVSRGMVPEENLVFDPEATLREVVWWTHYLPAGWKGRLHSKMVRSFFFFLPSPLHAFPHSLSFSEILKGHFDRTRHMSLPPISHILSFVLSYDCRLSSSSLLPPIPYILCV